MVLVFKKGDNFLEELKRRLKSKKIRGAFFHGLGGFLETELAFYDLEKKQYLNKKFSGGPFEVLSIDGNVVRDSNDLLIHCHAVLSDRDYKVFGGHLINAIVGGTLEINLCLTDLGRRILDKRTGLKLLHEL